MNLDRRFVMSSVFFFVLAGCAADTETAPDETSESTEELRRGSTTDGYVAVGEFIHFVGKGEVHCTGTIVGTHSVLTAAHCVDYKNVGKGKTGDAQFNVELTPKASAAYLVDSWVVFGTKPGADDLALLHLYGPGASTKIPRGQLRRAEPKTGDLAKMLGYGNYNCPLWDADAGNNDDKKRIYTYDWGTPPHALCAGDSGGPTFVSGQIAQVASQVTEGTILNPNSESEQFGHVWKHVDDIQLFIDLWD